MRTLPGGIASFLVAVLLAPLPLPAADAPELSVRHTIVIDAPRERVWEVVSDFARLDRWYPLVESSRLVLGKNRQVGCIREITRLNGTKVEEKLIAYDPWDMTFTYTYAGGQPMSSDYFATMTLTDAGEGKTLVEWKARFRRLAYWTDDPPPGQDDATVLNALNKAYPAGLANLKKIVEAQ
ncbi:MAG TPA: SRPBCC family protein [Burkholderiales bacterium]|nr:SRPBCC family protein [Burkholderiales bacterium]